MNSWLRGGSAVHADEAATNRFVGDQACRSCHADQSTPYLHTAHSRTSALVDRDSMRIAFADGPQTLTIQEIPSTGDPGLVFRMEEKSGAYFESAVTGVGSDLQTRTERMDVVIGSGKRGQTFLNWRGDQLFELPVSFWVDGKQWINSPGYVDGTADFNRPVNPGCLECHASSIKPLSESPLTNSYVKSSLVTGIGCETCHGAGGEHVALQQAGAAKKGAQKILNPHSFDRDRQMDLCALCHNGLQREPLAPAFSYVPGRPLGEFFKQLDTGVNDRPDVHGNQVGLLRKSRCYLGSPTMSCSTCHDVHAPEKQASAYSVKCLNCHSWQSCGAAKKLGHKIADDCVDCHMPVQPTSAIVSDTAGKEVRASMRTHWIKVYPADDVQVRKPGN